MQSDFETYIRNTAEIRRLSAPQLDELKNAEEYSEVLRDNFLSIGKLALENRGILEKELYPLLETTGRIEQEKMEALEEFSASLLDAYNLENLDPSIHLMLSERLLSSVDETGPQEAIIRQLDNEIMACYTMVNLTRRIFCSPQIAECYRKRGFAAGERVLRWLDKDKFAPLCDEAKEAVLINARYFVVMGEGAGADEELNRANFEALERALKLEDDPFFREQAPDYDWRYHRFRTLNYMAMLVEYHNERKIPQDILDKIAGYADELWELSQTDTDYFFQLDTEEEIRLIVDRAKFEAGVLDRSTYLRSCLGIYQSRNRESYDHSDFIINLLVPLEYMLLLDPEHITEEQGRYLEGFYQNMINYAYQMPNDGFLSYMLEYFSAILWHFIEVPGGTSFEDMCLNCMAALHPPTYIHTRMVGEITKCLTEHLAMKKPMIFRNIPEARDPEAFLNFAYHAAICHDFGKIPIIDTIMIYGRKILDMEFGIIKQHPDMGAQMLAKHASTRRYVNFARGHHKWYDNTGGYPEEFDTSTVSDRVLIDIITCADCLDAATDTVGRSYSSGKTLDEFIQELKEQSGTRYAPFLAEIFEDEDVKKDIQFILKQGRKKNYNNTYHLLRDVQET